MKPIGSRRFLQPHMHWKVLIAQETATSPRAPRQDHMAAIREVILRLQTLHIIEFVPCNGSGFLSIQYLRLVISDSSDLSKVRGPRPCERCKWDACKPGNLSRFHVVAKRQRRGCILYAMRAVEEDNDRESVLRKTSAAGAFRIIRANIAFHRLQNLHDCPF